jgi:general stress protein YciG
LASALQTGPKRYIVQPSQKILGHFQKEKENMLPSQTNETNNGLNNQPARKSTRGFASMNPERQREIARKGGRAAHEKGTAHEFTSEEARIAGRKGGQAVSRDRAHMALIGREGGQARGAKAAARQQMQSPIQQAS